MNILIKLFTLSVLIALTFGCSQKDLEKKEVCNLTDTIFKKLKYGDSEQTYKDFSLITDNHFFRVDTHNLKVTYRPDFVNGKLYYLKIEIETRKNETAMRSNLLNHDFYNTGIYERIANEYSKKYGQPKDTTVTADFSSWNNEEKGAIIWKTRDINIHKQIKWSCNNKSVTIEYDEKGRALNDYLETNPNVTALEASKTPAYNLSYYYNFNIIYVNDSLKKEKDIEKTGKIKTNRQKEDSLNSIESKKIQSDI